MVRSNKRTSPHNSVFWSHNTSFVAMAARGWGSNPQSASWHLRNTTIATNNHTVGRPLPGHYVKPLSTFVEGRSSSNTSLKSQASSVELFRSPSNNVQCSLCVGTGNEAISWSCDPVFKAISWSCDPLFKAISWSCDPVFKAISWSCDPLFKAISWYCVQGYKLILCSRLICKTIQRFSPSLPS